MPQAGPPLTAEQVQAGFIYNFTRYTEWPEEALEVPDRDHFHICVSGKSAVARQLELYVQNKMAGGRPIQIRRLNDGANVAGCEILYVHNVPNETEDRLLAAIAGKSILTIGSVPGYLRGAGMITFVLEDNRVRFDINLRAAERVNLRFDSRILAVARRINEGPQ